MRLSPFGEALLPHASQILDERARAIGELEALRSLRAGRVRVAIHPVFDEHVARLVMTEFKSPWVRVSVTKLAAIKGVKRLGVTIERGKKQ